QVPYMGEHIRANVIGAVCPESGQSFEMIFDGVDTDVFQCFLDHLAETIPPDPNKRRILILDNASWHKAVRLNWHHLECKFLPSYSPDFNPIERLWLRLKADYFTAFIAHTKQELIDRLCFALNALMDDTQMVASQCATRK
ncbi:MAG: transposase, partial [Verrucomicrobiota bacterium]